MRFSEQIRAANTVAYMTVKGGPTSMPLGFFFMLSRWFYNTYNHPFKNR